MIGTIFLKSTLVFRIDHEAAGVEAGEQGEGFQRERGCRLRQELLR